MPKDNVDWDFDAENDTDYVLELTFKKIKHGMMMKLFSMSQKAILKKRGIKVDGDVDTVPNFYVPDYYYPTLTKACNPVIKQIRRDLKGDKIEMITHKVTSGYFFRVRHEWNIRVIVQGVYADKRPKSFYSAFSASV